MRKRKKQLSLKLFLKRRRLLLITGILAAVPLAGLGAKTLLFKAQPSIDTNSQDIFKDEAALKLYVQQYGPQKTIKQLHELSATFGNCHDVAHKAGNLAFEIFGDRAFKEGGAECHSGLYHGATEAYFKKFGTAKLGENLKTLCSYGGNDFFNHQCFHGIGHGLMAWTNYELIEALETCDMLDQLRDSCYTGVFMENIVGGLAKEQRGQPGGGHFTKYLNDDPQYPCTVVDVKYRSSCYFLQTSRMMQLLNYEFAQVAKACNAAESSYHYVCFSSLGRDIGAVNRKNPSNAIQACSQAPAGQLRIGCLGGAVQDYFWDPSGQDSAIAFCQLLTESAEKSACYSTIFQRASDLLTDRSARDAFCAKPETAHQTDCRRLLRL
jgi:hypothetical protein